MAADTLGADGGQPVTADPEVQELMRRLAPYGLGVCLPHMHVTEQELTPLPPGTVQFEADLRVSFVDEHDPEVQAALPVAWVWDDGVRVVGRCRQGHTATH
jgi:hypothetical protein